MIDCKHCYHTKFKYATPKAKHGKFEPLSINQTFTVTTINPLTYYPDGEVCCWCGTEKPKELEDCKHWSISNDSTVDNARCAYCGEPMKPKDI